VHKVKICGITNLEDALWAIKCGADALGFVFYEKSPRFIQPHSAKEIVKKLPPFVEKVGLFVNVTSEEVNFTCKSAFMSLAQIHFEADEDFFEALEVPYLKVIRATCKEDLSKFSDEYRLVDAFVQSYGGEGKRVDLDWFEGVDCSKIILAGGLNISNLDEVKKYNFYGFDVSSSVEKDKGVKDHLKIEAFISKAKS
jgi:phosphoribosylanthranilate isomerase